MPSWKKQRLKMKDDHVWRAKPGHKIFVADRGSVRFDIPGSWVVIPSEENIRIHDKQPPADDMAFTITIFNLPPLDWSELPLLPMLEDSTNDPKMDLISKGEIFQLHRGDLEIVWRELHFIDPVEHREAISRVSTARRKLVQSVITLDFWLLDLARGNRIWQTFLDTLQLAEYIQDPTTGR
jgi:hypothetical protein